MILNFMALEIPCARAEKSADFVKAYDESGVCIFEATGVTDFSSYSLDDGEWSEAESSPEEQMAALAEENKRLKAKLDMHAQNLTFLEDCLLEMGDVVYA